MPDFAAVASTAAPHNRRQRLRLRDLCDEVLASYRAAHDRDLISEDERSAARALLATLGPRHG